jgi:ribonuclease E
MANKMIIDASHPEETRVVVLRGNRVEEFDFESASKKQLRGNIYLAKVTRVEPSLQAAFVEYGGNRHGFLAFSEIHPDYYQIPHSDRVALLEEESRAHREEEDEDSSRRRSRRHRRGSERRRPNDDERVSGEVLSDDERAAGSEAQTVEFTENQVSYVDEGAFPVASEGDAEAAPPPVDFVAVEVTAEEAPEAFAPAQEEPAQETPLQEALPLETAQVEASAPEEAPAPYEAPAQIEAVARESHELAHDPEGFAVVEEDDEEDAHENGFATANAGAISDEAYADEAPERRPVQDEVFHDEDAQPRRFSNREPDGENGDNADEEEEIVDQLGGDAMDETPYRAQRSRRQYKIQEVIKRRQVLLIQVVKEERGNKGAALTTYLSLAGRYSVLMPNTARGGGISRKITDATDRKRLKEIAQELEVPEGMGVILRTAGAARTKPEVKRDFEYLMRMWETVRELTLSSSAPSLVYEEGSLIKRAIRDLYSREIDDVVVAGEAGYREARDFMRLLMPSHVKNVHYYRDPQPVFAKWGAESQLDALFHTQVTLKSGGYLVINQTEALVAIDVNSGRSTREHNIEDTAVRTNLEAADEVARQLRLRDLAGLIVVDFIDMEENRNNRAVERRIKEALKDDRARIQVGRISHFGLLEMSRQRIRTGVLEGSSIVCPHCAGAGTVRSTASVAVHVMRVLEDALIKSASHNVILRTRTDIALYILNQKRSLLRLIEERFGVAVTVEADDSLVGGAYHALERGEPAAGVTGDPIRRFDPRRPVEDAEPIGEAESEGDFDEEAEVSEAAEVEVTEENGETAESAEAENRRRRRRRRGRGRNFEREGSGVEASGEQPSDEGLETMAAIGGDLILPVATESAEDGGFEPSSEEGSEGGRRGRGRWRRRGRGGRNGENAEFNGDWRPSAEARDESEAGAPAVETSGEASAETPAQQGDSPPVFAPLPEWGGETPVPESALAAEFAPPFAPDFASDFAAPSAVEPAAPVAEVTEASAPEPKAVVEAPQEPVAVEPAAPAPKPAPRAPELPAITQADPDKPKRSGWWAKAKANLTGQ